MTGRLTRPLQGIIPPLITPLAGPDQLDVPGLERLIEHVIAGGVHGLFVLGTTGEGPNLGYRLRRELVQRVGRQVGGRLPVLVGITDTSLVEALAMARHAAASGACAVVTSAPYYYPSSQPELYRFVERLVLELPLPLFLYNMPAMTKTWFAPDTLRRLAQIEGIAGIKDSSGDLAYFRQVLEVARDRPDWRVFMGPEHLLVEALRLGAHGGVNGGALVEPGLLVGLYEAALRRDEVRTAALQSRLLRLGAIFEVDPHPSAVVKGLKCALSLLGLCSDLPAEPLTPFGGAEREKVRATLSNLGLLKPGAGMASPAR